MTGRSALAPPAAQAPPEAPRAGVGGELGAALGVALRELGGGRRVDGQRDAALGDAGHLGGVDEPPARRRVEDDPVEEMLALVLQHGPDGADLDAVGGPHRRAAREHLVGDGVAVVAHAVTTAAVIVATTRTTATAMTARSPARLSGNVPREMPESASTTANTASRPPQT